MEMLLPGAILSQALSRDVEVAPPWGLETGTVAWRVSAALQLQVHPNGSFRFPGQKPRAREQL